MQLPRIMFTYSPRVVVCVDREYSNLPSLQHFHDARPGARTAVCTPPFWGQGPIQKGAWHLIWGHMHIGALWRGGGRGAQSVNSTKRRLSLYQCTRKVCLLCLYFSCRRPTWGLHDDYMGPSWDLHKAYMRPAWGLNEAYMRYTWGLQYVRSTVYKACRTANE